MSSVPGDGRPSLPSSPAVDEPPRASRSIEAPAVWHPAPAQRRASRRGLVAGGVAAALALAGGAIVLTKSGRRREGTPAATAPRPSGAPGASIAAAPSSPPAPKASVAVASAIPSASASAPLAPSPADISRCISSIFPDDTFASDADLDDVCTQPDPRKAAAFLRSRIASHGFEAKATTDGMRLWANLSWYELAAVGIARGACCPSPSPIDLPAPVGTCPPLASAIDGLAASVRSRADVNASLKTFREAARCTEHGYTLNSGVPSPYDYRGPLGGGAESAFRLLLERATAR
jgi:hypothetical protein